MQFRINALNLTKSKPVDVRLNQLHIRFAKRAFDLGISVVFLLPASSTCFLISIILLANSYQLRNIFFKQARWGKNRKIFMMYKFNSMYEGSRQFDEDGNFIQVSEDDPRVTKIGKFLRKKSLDEIPQIINVIKGDMSIVGPRPHPIEMNLEYLDKIRGYKDRHNVKPGITGLAQVRGLRGEIKNLEMMQDRVDLDIWYINNWSFWLDIKIIFWTVRKMFTGDKNAY